MNDERAERMRRRRQSREEKTSEPSKTDKTEQTEKKEKTGKSSVKDRPSVLMYLPEEQHKELDILFDELNAAYKRAHDGELEKNRDYYPAVIEAGLDKKRLKDALDI